jgi:glycosyltransferase involved in cell wall biosynthesis
MSQVDILFVHSNFPAQFRNLAQTFSASPRMRVKAIGSATAPGLDGVELLKYDFSGRELGPVHSFARRFELESRRAEQVLYAANALRLSGFEPKLIYVHPGWGEALPLRALFPDATICCYGEFYYWPFGADVGFDKEFPALGIDGEVRVSLRNAATALSMIEADFAVSPTQWQKTVFPKEFQSKIHVVHDGLDIPRLKALAGSGLAGIHGETIQPGDEIVTFVARNLEPYRGFHVFMRALPALLRERPKARVYIVGGDRVSYGNKPAAHETWREAMLAELGSDLDLSRVHFLGALPFDKYLKLLKISSAHVYLTYPFVLSWSALEAMALGCLMIGSDTPPVTEVIQHGVNGLIVPFFQPEAIAATVAEALAHPDRYAGLRAEAARVAAERYDYRSVIWPAHAALLQEQVLAGSVREAVGELLRPSSGGAAAR